ncbi:hypothetical protein [Arthrobacter sp. ISL-5]|uniref:hypothetical protein n=1 Tax=Arthrobacter sp. ISL-5 TaxID=2819111 RepID=UPI001BE77A9C|nr:hypothetical protein [Arthrobacter sp. ISL-5]MBT2555477.1 hypothetical protein [Arthrobacter sp. ISL-5]
MLALTDYAIGAHISAQNAIARAVDSALEKSSEFRWVWLVLIGILVVAAAAAWVYCRKSGYDGFTGDISAVRGPWGVKIGIKLGCY